MYELIQNLYLKYLGNKFLNKLTDACVLDLTSKQVVFSTDSFVVKPLFFPDSDIGELAIAGTVNDLLMLGANPKYISLSLIIQENFPFISLEKIIKSIAKASNKAGVLVVTGDTKVVDSNACDGIFINTSGIGVKLPQARLGFENIKQEDCLLINGSIGQHGLSIISARENLKFNVKSDCQSLEGLIIPALKEFKSDIHFLRDPTRGGLATTLNEICLGAHCCVIIDEAKIPLSETIQYSCEVLGFDPLYLANEGKAVFVVDKRIVNQLLKFLRKKSLGKNASIIGKIKDFKQAKVVAQTSVGSSRLIDMRDGDPLPRIC